MKDTNLGKIVMDNLQVSCTIGDLPEERTGRQTIRLYLELTIDFSAVQRSDNLNDTVDYAAVEQFILKYVPHTSFKLLETLISNLANELLHHFHNLQHVLIRVQKVHTWLHSNVSVELSKSRI